MRSLPMDSMYSNYRQTVGHTSQPGYILVHLPSQIADAKNKNIYASLFTVKVA